MDSLKKDNTRDFAFVLLIFFTLACCFAFSVSYCSKNNHKESIALDYRINPNDARLGSLICLPNIGISKAQAIIKYRESQISNGSSRPFTAVYDMEKVKGIGPKTAAAMGDWLKFE